VSDERPADRSTETDPELTHRNDAGAAPAGVDPGAFIGRDAELTRADIPEAGAAPRTRIPDPGWNDTPEGHREGSKANDDELKRKG